MITISSEHDKGATVSIHGPKDEVFREFIELVCAGFSGIVDLSPLRAHAVWLNLCIVIPNILMDSNYGVKDKIKIDPDFLNFCEETTND